MGWRYLLFALGGMTLFLWALRFFVFPLEESPRFLVGRGRDADAVAADIRAAVTERLPRLFAEGTAGAGDGTSDAA